MKITKTTDKEVANAVLEGLKKNGGYCPCRVEKTPETRCMCKEFVEQQVDGYCHCGLYYKTMND